MVKRAIFAFLALNLLAPLAGAQGTLSITKTRVTLGPMGATRKDMQFLPGDYLFMSFEVDGLTFDPKTGKATYETVLELFDTKNKKIFDQKNENTVSPMLGGTKIPGDFHVIMGTDQPPGKYQIRLIIKDKLSKAKQPMQWVVKEFDLLPPGFGVVGVTAPAVGFAGQHYVANFALVNTKLDAKNKPNVEVRMRVLDDSGTADMTRPITTLLPKDMPADLNLVKENFVPMQFPIYLNRPGRYTVEIEAFDRAANRQSKLRYKLTVFEINKLAGQ